MAKKCVITNKSSKVSGGYSNRVRATKFNPSGNTRRYANIQKRRIFVPETGKTVIINVSAKGLKTMKKNGVHASLKKAGVI